ncbi:MAG: GNAT family protein [Planifilum fimeticola]
MTLTVVSKNRPAKALYEKLGFQKYGTYPRSMRVNGRVLDEDYMVLFLKDSQEGRK